MNFAENATPDFRCGILGVPGLWRPGAINLVGWQKQKWIGRRAEKYGLGDQAQSFMDGLTRKHGDGKGLSTPDMVLQRNRGEYLWTES